MKKTLLSIAFLALPVIAFGAGCEDYPYSDGMSIEDVAGGTKILATASASVSFDDPDSIRDAKDEAKLLAKAEISRFLSETIKSDDSITKAVNETKSMAGAGKEIVRKEVADKVIVLRNSSQALLRGVVQLGDCYTKGREVRVSVGLKPETINSAGNTAASISESVATKPVPDAGMAQSHTTPSSPSDAASGTNKTPLQGVESHSNTGGLKNF